MSKEATIDFALMYLEKGMSVFPLQPRSKVPFFNWRKWTYQRPTRDQVIEWWEAMPSANIAIITGSISGLFVVDCDHPAIAAIHTNEPDYSPTWCVRTGKGMHFYHALPSFWVSNRTGLIDGSFGAVDIRGEGGYVVAPPSIHPSGRRYELGDYRTLQPCPAAILDRLKPKQAQTSPLKAFKPSTTPQDHWRRVLDAETSAVALAPDGSINNTLNKAAYNLGQLIGDGLLDRSQVEDALYTAAVGRGETEGRAMRTIQSGIEAGIANPRSYRGR